MAILTSRQIEILGLVPAGGNSEVAEKLYSAWGCQSPGGRGGFGTVGSLNGKKSS